MPNKAGKNPALFYKLNQELAARKDLNGSDKVLFAVIADRVGKNGKCWPGTRKLAENTGLNRETVIKATKRLESAGLLIVERRKNGQGNHYRTSLESGRKTQPVGKPNRSENPTTTGRKTQPEAVGKPNHNQTDQLTRPKYVRRKKTATPNPQVKEFIDWFSQTYKKELTCKYIVRGGKDGKLVKKLLEQVSISQLKKSAQAMLSDSWGRKNASIGTLSNQINKWLNNSSPSNSPSETTKGKHNAKVLKEIFENEKS